MLLVNYPWTHQKYFDSGILIYSVVSTYRRLRIVEVNNDRVVLIMLPNHVEFTLVFKMTRHILVKKL